MASVGLNHLTAHSVAESMKCQAAHERKIAKERTKLVGHP